MQSTGVITDLSLDIATKKAKISLVLDTNDINVVEQLKNENKLNVELKKYRQKRSLDANAYFWKLLQELCEKQDLNTIEEYKRRVKELGIFRRFRIEEKDVKTFMIMWEDKGIAWFCEIADTEYLEDTEFKIINAHLFTIK